MLHLVDFELGYKKKQHKLFSTVVLFEDTVII